MQLVAAKCPTCSAALEVNESLDKAKCEFCGTDVLIREHHDERPSVRNFLTLARKALKARNHSEAYGYFTKVLESTPDNAEAWFHKGACAGWMSTLKDFRLPEMLVAFEAALENVQGEKKKEIQHNAALEIRSCTVAYYSLAKKSLDEYICLDETWGEYLDQCEEAIEALEKAHEYEPTDLQIIKNIVVLCQDNLDGRAYHDRYDTDDDGNPIRKVKRVAPLYREKLLAKRDVYIARARVMDPTFMTPPRPVAGGTSLRVPLAILGAIGAAGFLISGIKSCSESPATPPSAAPPVASVPAPPPPPPPKVEAVVYAGGCNLRAEPRPGSKRVGHAKAGKEYVILEKNGAWRRHVLENGIAGWAACTLNRPREDGN